MGDPTRASPPDPAELPVEDSIRLPRTQVLMLASIGGLLLGVAIVFADASTWNHATWRFVKSGPFALWLALIAAQTMLWTLAFPPLRATFLRHLRDPGRESLWKEVIPSAAIIVALVTALSLLPRFAVPLPVVVPRSHLKLDVVILLALVAAVVAGMSIWLIRARLVRLAAAGRSGRPEVSAYQRLRSELEWLLGYLALVIALAVMASAALRNAIGESLKESGCKLDACNPSLSPQAIILYGLILSLLVALAYLPTYATLLHTGGVLRDGLEPPPDPAGERFETALDRRRLLDEVLGLQASASTSFKIAAAISAPLIGSLTSLLPRLGG